MPIFPASQENIKKAGAIIRAGGVVAFPTETVYGLGASAFKDSAIEQIYRLKRRPSTNPLIVHTDSASSARALFAEQLSPYQENAFQKISTLWPGSLTVVLPSCDRISKILRAGGFSVGIRVPDHQVAISLIKEAGVPIAAPSANPSGYVSPTTAKHVDDSFSMAAPFIIDGGACKSGIESTVVLLAENHAALLRPGAISPGKISSLIGELKIATDLKMAGEALLSPGQLPQHYSPRTKLILRSQFNPEKFLAAKIGVISFSEIPFYSSNIYISLSKNRDLYQVARKLYSALRELDNMMLDLIVIDECQVEDLGYAELSIAIEDRIRRAANQD
jgi:L-threonylcarbamoyladenylate synthase